MSEALPTPPASPGRSIFPAREGPDSSAVKLAKELDALLERYLHLLDKQQKLQEEIGRHMSAGFLSLARANQSCPPGRWYGQDYYDERMKAIRTVEIFNGKPLNLRGQDASSGETQDVKLHDRIQDNNIPRNFQASSFRIVSAPTEMPIKPPVSPVEKPDNAGDSSSKPEESIARTLDDPSDQSTLTSASTSTTSNKSPASASSNPLRWFGILVPPSLRAAQRFFTSAVEGPVPALVSVIAEMREVEDQIKDLRDRLAVKRDKP
ncbi:hypothetical protein VTO42DRAFT_1620 [Malbranchea cinnamomea]